MAPSSDHESEHETATESTPDIVNDEITVSAHQSSPDRTVFTEDGNSDGWIATDLTVDLRR